MYKQMLTHKQAVKIRLKKAKNKEDLRDLARFHHARITEFQHERLVHLLVTFFFALLCLCALGMFFWLSSLALDELLAELAGNYGASAGYFGIVLYSLLLPIGKRYPKII